MDKKIKLLIVAVMVLSIPVQVSFGQAYDEERMQRDLEVSENVLATLIKRGISDDRTLFGLDITGSYQPGYGVTFRLPPDHVMPFAITITEHQRRGTVISDGFGYRYSNIDGVGEPSDDQSIKLKEKSQITADSLRAAYHQGLINAASNFILDYGDLISQLEPHEKIVVTNQHDRLQFYFNSGKRTRISVEGTRQDIAAFRKGSLTREEAIKRLDVVKTESIDVREPDMEMLASIFSRLYRPDLSKTYFVQGNVYYERLKDFGTIFYMQMVSSTETPFGRHAIPTLGLQDIDQETRDKKVAELYPLFEKELKENILEYGRTLKTLKGDERLIFNVILTKCHGCGIPGTLEVSIKGADLTAFGAGKIDMDTAMRKFTLKAGVAQ